MTNPVGALFERDSAHADVRYGRGFRGGVVAELFGLGPYGLYWRQVAILTVGIWLSSNIQATGGMLSAPDGAYLLRLLSWPIFFMFSAITAIRSFQGPLAVAGRIMSAVGTTVAFWVAWRTRPVPHRQP